MTNVENVDIQRHLAIIAESFVQANKSNISCFSNAGLTPNLHLLILDNFHHIRVVIESLLTGFLKKIVQR